MIEQTNSLEIEVFYKKDVPAMLTDSRLWNQSYFATTKHRLNVHYQNPAMDMDDVLLIVAWYDQIMIGYIGAFSDYLLTANGYEKITWLHSWWMNPEYRFTKAGLMLFQKINETCNRRTGISQFTPSAGRIYFKSGLYQVLTTMKGCKFILEIQLTQLVKSSKKWYFPLLPFTYLIDQGMNTGALLARKLAVSTLPNPKAEYIAVLDQETVDFIQSKQPVQICKRDKSFFDFLFRYRVILPAQTPSIYKDRYYFSNHARVFDFYFIKGLDTNNSIESFMVVQIRDGVLKILYAYYNESAIKNCTILIQRHASKLKCHTILLYDDQLITALSQSRMQYILKRRKEKEILVSKDFSPTPEWEKQVFNYGDGDCCFA